ncbi:hypothetical protein FACS1894187_08500 [Synergistales bacterium]|nr:hypothetical protein FACS1894187_08500 [Synergistales bacterium]
MKVLAINGGPRKNWNTAKLLAKALEGAVSAGAEACETVHLYDLNFKGCSSCFMCKRKDGHPGKCAMNDGLSPVLEQIKGVGLLLLASPIYLSDVTGAMRSFLERALFSNLAYRATDRSCFKGRANVGFIYTMNVTQEAMETLGYERIYKENVRYLSNLNGRVEYLASTDTYQFDDYSKYEAPLFDEAKKANARETQFPEDLRNAFDMGARLAGN